jgi:hypothetical protein
VTTLVLAVLVATVAMVVAYRPGRPRAVLLSGSAVVGTGLCLLLMCWLHASFGQLVDQPLPARAGGWATAWVVGWVLCGLGVLVTAVGLVHNRRRSPDERSARGAETAP